MNAEPMPGFHPDILAALTLDELKGSAEDCIKASVRAQEVYTKLSLRGVDRGTLLPLRQTVDRWRMSFNYVQREIAVRHVSAEMEAKEGVR